MIQVHALEIRQLERFLERHKSGLSLKDEVDLDLVLRQILQRAYEFVPAESGSILLDDPSNKLPDRIENELAFIAAFGDRGRELLGQRLSAKYGIVGQVYRTGTPHLSVDVAMDGHFYGAIDERLGHKTHSIVAVPIYIGKTVCGVLELINRQEGQNFTPRDMALLEIFAGYTSFVLQNALDAKRAHELAKRDDLTGLYNDRWFHVCLTEVIAESRRTGKEATIIFLDLDQFKAVNDTYGHLAGSQMLREVGFLLSRLVHLPNATVARYGGDEFVMIFPDTPAADSVTMCDEIRHAIYDANFLSRKWGFSMPPLNLRGVVSASIGMAEYRPDPIVHHSIEEDRNDVLRRADGAMYEAKALGGNRVIVAGTTDNGAKVRHPVEGGF
jgi:diguanylate cyclase (GGDEF)-like protein